MDKKAFITQLGYDTNEHIIQQMNSILNKNGNITKLFNHLITLHDKLKHINGFVAMSNSENVLKIKCENSSPKLLEEFHEIVKKFKDKYKLNLKKLENKEVYYIVGFLYEQR